MISERGGEIQGLGLIMRGRELPKKSLFQRRTLELWSAYSKEGVCEIIRRIRFRDDGVLPQRQ